MSVVSKGVNSIRFEILLLASRISVVYMANDICRRSSVTRKENAKNIPILLKTIEMPFIAVGQVWSLRQKRYVKKGPLVGWFQFITAVVIVGVRTNSTTEIACRSRSL